MSDMYEMKKDETVREYVNRIVMLKDQIGAWTRVAEIINAHTGEDRSPDSYRKRYYANKRRMETFSVVCPKNKQDSLIFDSEQAQDFLDLESQRQQISDEKREIKGLVREYARMDTFKREIIECFEKSQGSPVKIPKIKSKKSKKSGILTVADMHFGKNFELLDFEGNVQNSYNPDIFYKRMAMIIKETKEIVEKEGLTEIDIFSLGDIIEGDIRPTTRYALQYTIPEQVVMAGKYMSKWVEEITKFVKVRYHQTSGNHGDVRLDGYTKTNDPRNNVEPIIEAMIESWNRDNPNFTCVKNPTGYIFQKVAGFNVLGIHGEVKNAEKAMLEFSNFYKKHIDYMVMGHNHSQNYKNTGEKRAVIGAGSIVGSDTYSKQLRKMSDANATFIILEPNKGVTQEHTIVLN